MTTKEFKNTYRPEYLLGILFIMLLSACDTISNTIDNVNLFKERPPLFCPSVSILGDSEQITIFKEGAGRDIIDIKTEALIDDFIAKCIYQVDNDTFVGKIIVELSLGYTASRGPANKEGTFVLPYFVTILDKDKNILNKAIFSVNSVFDGNRYRITAYDAPIAMAIPVAPPVTGQDFYIYIGFQLTPAQIKYNQQDG